MNDGVMHFTYSNMQSFHVKSFLELRIGGGGGTEEIASLLRRTNFKFGGGLNNTVERGEFHFSAMFASMMVMPLILTNKDDLEF